MTLKKTASKANTMKRTVRDTEISKRVGELLDMSSIAVGGVIQAFFYEVMEHLVDKNEVYISGFGTFHVSVRKGKRLPITRLNRSSDCHGNSIGTTLVKVKRKYYVNFRRACVFRKKFIARYGTHKAKAVLNE